MSKEKAIQKYETEVKMAKVLAGVGIVGGVIAPIVLLGTGFGSVLALFGLVFSGYMYSLKPEKKYRVPMLEIGTLVYHNPMVSGGENHPDKRLYEMSATMDYTKVLPVWTVVYHNEDSYVIEHNGNKHEISYRKQDNLIPVLEAKSQKEIEFKGIKA